MQVCAPVTRAIAIEGKGSNAACELSIDARLRVAVAQTGPQLAKVGEEDESDEEDACCSCCCEPSFHAPLLTGVALSEAAVSEEDGVGS